MCKGEDPGWMRDVRRECGDWNVRNAAGWRHTGKSRLWELLEDGWQKADGASAEDERTAQACLVVPVLATDGYGRLRQHVWTIA
jgi:hypothetical protein